VVIYRLPIMLERRWRLQAVEQLCADEPASPQPACKEPVVAPAELDSPPMEAATSAPENAETAPVTATAASMRDEAQFNLFLPRSHCPSCGHGIRAMENIPIVSWLALRGACSACGAHISPRYPIVEALTAGTALAVVVAFGWTWLAVAFVGYTCVLIALACIDCDTRLLPDQLTLPLLWAGLLTNTLLGFVSPTSAIFGAVGAYLSLWMIYWAFKWLTGKEGMGYGDFKLFAAIGAWLGWAALPAVLLMAAFVGLVYALVSIALKRRTRREPLPFGPFLAMAGWCALMFRDLAVMY